MNTRKPALRPNITSLLFYTNKPVQDGRHFIDGISFAFSWQKIIVFDSQFTEVSNSKSVYNDSNLDRVKAYCRETIPWTNPGPVHHYNDVIMNAVASQIIGLTIVYSTVYSGADQRKHQSSASLAFVRGIHRRPMNSPHKGPVKGVLWDIATKTYPNLNGGVIKPHGWVITCNWFMWIWLLILVLNFIAFEPIPLSWSPTE